MDVLRDGKCQRCDELDSQSNNSLSQQQRRNDRDRKPQEITSIQKQQYSTSGQSHQSRQSTNQSQKQTQSRPDQQHQPRQQAKVPDPEDDKYERRGDYYQCIKCEEYTVHVNDDKHCENRKCPSNEGK